MIKVTVLIGRERDGAAETISAASIREAVEIVQARHPEEEIRVAYPIDPETFFLGQRTREAVGVG